MVRALPQQALRTTADNKLASPCPWHRKNGVPAQELSRRFGSRVTVDPDRGVVTCIGGRAAEAANAVRRQIAAEQAGSVLGAKPPPERVVHVLPGHARWAFVPYTGPSSEPPVVKGRKLAQYVPSPLPGGGEGGSTSGSGGGGGSAGVDELSGLMQAQTLRDGPRASRAVGKLEVLMRDGQLAAGCRLAMCESVAQVRKTGA
eukprot:352528-Chlamydomonas_euryale.AAC.1